jgi:uncharacterized protein YegL
MTTFAAQISQNQYLAPGASAIQAVLSVAATPAAGAAAPSGQQLVEALILDCSSSMEGEKLRCAQAALATTLDLLHEDAWFCVIMGTQVGRVAFPLAQATVGNKREAKMAVRQLKADGGTAMSTWLDRAREELAKRPGGIHHALLLTDGKNEGESDAHLAAALQRGEGAFQCDARGVGTNWVPDQLRKISTRLLGTLDIIPQPADIAADFQRVMESAMSKAVTDVSLRLWTPQGASVGFCKQVYPQQVDLTARGKPDPKNPQLRDYPTGAWGEEKRDYHIGIQGLSGKVGQRMCAGRASLLLSEHGKETKAAEGMILAIWTEDEAQSAVIHPAVAHYTGQSELAEVIQQGLKARAAGEEGKAEQLFGRAVQIAAETNPETMKLLRKVVHVEDERTGTVKLLRGVKKEDEFALDTRSTKTARVPKEA